MSILSDVKKVIPIPDYVDDFDDALLIHINSEFFILRQIGVIPYDGTTVDSTTEWSAFSVIGSEESIEAVKQLVPLKVKKVFDPPQSGAAMQALNDMITELEYRLNWNADYKL